MNLGFLGKGNASQPDALIEQVAAGACGLKLHEDWGTTPAAIDSCLTRRRARRRAGGDPHRHAERVGLRRGHHRRLQGPHHPHLPHRRRRRRPRARHHQGVRAAPTCCRRSTNPTRPYTVNTIDEHLDMLMVCHHLDPRIPEDVAFAESRIRRETIAAEDILHDLGAFSHDLVRQPGDGPGRRGDHPHLADRPQDEAAARRRCRARRRGNDNFRVKRYIAKYTINPAITHGIAAQVGSVEVGKLADLVLWTAGVLRRQAGPGPEGRHDRRGADGRSERLDPDAAAGALPADVRRLRPRAARTAR